MRKAKRKAPQQKPAKRNRHWGAGESKHGRPYKSSIPLPKRMAVFGLYLSGAKRRAISRELGLDRETVSRIITQEESSELVQGFRQAVLRIVPDALIAAHELVKRLDQRMVAEILYGSRTLIQRHEIEKVEEPKRTYAYTRVEFFGKYGRWPRNEELAEFEKTLVEMPIIKGELRE